MENMHIDTGMLELDVNGNGILRFNPSDTALCNKMVAFARRVPEIQRAAKSRFTAPAAIEDPTERTSAMLDELRAFDLEVKGELNAIFGGDTDFDKLLAGVSLFSIGNNGKFVLQNLLEALMPHIAAGAREKAMAIAEEVKKKREARKSGENNSENNG